MGQKIGILIPEFPGQTHNFFWREIAALREFGATVSLFSTRKPPAGVQSTSWGVDAMRETTYLFPVPVPTLLRVALDLLLSPNRTMRCARLFLSSRKALDDGESSLRLLSLMAIGIALGRVCRARAISHLHVHSCADAANVALFAHVAFGISYSMTLHNPLSIWGGNQRQKWKHARFGIVIADWILRDLRQRLGDSLPQQLFVAPMGVDLEKFKRRLPYRSPTDGVTKVFSCGRLNPAKGFVYLIEAVQLLRESGRSIRLTVAGEDDVGGTGYRKELEALICSRGLQDVVDLLGAVPEERVLQELESAHVFALASLEEPLGVAIMEAMAMEVPVVATNAGGVPDLLCFGAVGALVVPGDAKDLAAGIERVVSDPDTAARMGRGGRDRVVEAFHHRISSLVIFKNAM